MSKAIAFPVSFVDLTFCASDLAKRNNFQAWKKIDERKVKSVARKMCSFWHSYRESYAASPKFDLLQF
jgi:hypothetical protein